MITSKEIILMARCLPFKDMSLDEFVEYQNAISTLMAMVKGANEVKTNAAKRTGKMYAIDWRGDTFLIQNIFMISF